MENLQHAYDLTQDGERATGWIPYCGEHLGVSSEGDGRVYVWDTQSPTDTDKMFDTDELGVDEFLSAVQEWVHEEISEGHSEVSV